MPNVYRKKAFTEVNERPHQAASDAQKAEVNQIMSKFIELFKLRFLN